ncbi:MAG: hypothetical protein AAF414_21165, partial [Pseudomonadota bacterium]
MTLPNYLASAVAAMLLFSGAANAQSPATCGNFQVTLELNHIEYLDDGEEGVSAGDRRVGRFDIFS